MKAIRCREWGAPDVLRLEEAESPNRKQHQVRLRVRAAGVNLADSLMVGGTYQVKPQFPFTPGLEAAGEIVETGSRSMAWGWGSGRSRCCATAAAMPRRLCSTPPRWCRSGLGARCRDDPVGQLDDDARTGAFAIGRLQRDD